MEPACASGPRAVLSSAGERPHSREGNWHPLRDTSPRKFSECRRKSSASLASRACQQLRGPFHWVDFEPLEANGPALGAVSPFLGLPQACGLHRLQELAEAGQEAGDEQWPLRPGVLPSAEVLSRISARCQKTSLAPCVSDPALGNTLGTRAGHKEGACVPAGLWGWWAGAEANTPCPPPVLLPPPRSSRHLPRSSTSAGSSSWRERKRSQN